MLQEIRVVQGERAKKQVGMIKLRKFKLWYCCSIFSFAVMPICVYSADSSLQTSKIEFAKLKTKLHLVNCEKSPFDILTCDIPIRGEPISPLISMEIHGKNPNDADKLVVGCSRFRKDVKILENQNTICGNIYEQALSTIINSHLDIVMRLMNEAARIGKENSRSKVNTNNFVFEYDNNGIFIANRVFHQSK